jgi:putative flippase GtrA
LRLKAAGGGGRRTFATRRGLVFALVGVVGYIVQTVALWVLVSRAGMGVVTATLVATELAVIHNFIWHVRWTWADRPAGALAVVGRFARFNVSNGGISLAGGAASMAVLVHAIGMPYLWANLLTVLACSVANFLAGDRWVFTGPGLRPLPGDGLHRPHDRVEGRRRSRAEHRVQDVPRHQPVV